MSNSTCRQQANHCVDERPVFRQRPLACHEPLRHVAGDQREDQLRQRARADVGPDRSAVHMRLAAQWPASAPGRRGPRQSRPLARPAGPAGAAASTPTSWSLSRCSRLGRSTLSCCPQFASTGRSQRPGHGQREERPLAAEAQGDRTPAEADGVRDLLGARSEAALDEDRPRARHDLFVAEGGGSRHRRNGQAASSALPEPARCRRRAGDAP